VPAQPSLPARTLTISLVQTIGTWRPERPPVDLLRPFDADKMKAWRVDQRINNVKNNDPELGEPFNEEADGQLGIFCE